MRKKVTLKNPLATEKLISPSGTPNSEILIISNITKETSNTIIPNNNSIMLKQQFNTLRFGLSSLSNLL